MKCNKCGAEIKDTMKFCNKCGAKVSFDVPKAGPVPVKADVNKPIEPINVATPQSSTNKTDATKTNNDAEAPNVVEAPNTAELSKEETSTKVETPAVTKEVPASQPVVKVEKPKPVNKQKPVKPLKPKNKVLAGILAILLGFFGIHWFYLGKPLRAIIYLAVYLVFPFIWLLYIVEGIFFLCAKQELFDKYRSFL